MRPAPAGPWSRRPSSPPLQAVGERLDRGELDPLILRYAGPGGRREVAHIRPLLRREALEYKLAVELGIPLYSFQERPFGRTQTVPLGTLFHVTAGNVDGLPAFSAVGGPAHRQYQSGEAALRGPGALPGRLSAADGAGAPSGPLPLRLPDPIPGHRRPATAGRSGRRGGGVGRRRGGDCPAAAGPARLQADGVGPPPQLCLSVPVGGRGGRSLPLWRSTSSRPGTALLLLPGHLSGHGRPRGGDAFCRSFVPCWSGQRTASRAALGEKGEGSLYAWETRLEHAADRLPGTLFPGRGCSLTLREDRELELSPSTAMCW